MQTSTEKVGCSEAEKLGTRFVSTETIRKKIAPLSRLSNQELLDVIAKYDLDGVGGLSEPQWAQFCSENRHLFSTLRVELINFDRSGEYILFTVNETSEKTKGLAKGVVQFLDGFVAGGVAGAFSKTVIAPGDRVKIIFQVDSKRPFSLREAFRLGVRTVREYGVTGLWIGNGATMIRVVPYAAITYLSFDYYKSLFNYVLRCIGFDLGPESHTSVAVRFLCGALAGATSTTCTYPLDLMRARFAANSSDKKTRFPSYRVAFHLATKKDGAKSLYSGLFPTVVGIMPYAGLSFACFETIKHKLVQHFDLENDQAIPVWQRLCAGGFSGLVAQSSTYPLDIVRRRMQVTPNRYKGICHALRTIYREEGLRQGLFKGLSMNWIKGPIAVASSFTVNDLIKRRTRQYHDHVGKASPESRVKPTAVTLPESLLCGGVAAGVAKFWTLPFDKLKIMHHLGVADNMNGRLHSLRNIKEILKKNPNMWASGNVMMMRVVPYGALTYSIFDFTQSIAERVTYSKEPTLLTNFVGGASAAAAATFIVYPLDLFRTRSAVTTNPKFQSYYWLMRAMSKRHGIGSLWEGCYVSMMGVGMLAGIGFASYEYLKKKFELESFGSRLCAGMLAGAAGQALWPMNMLKLKRQTEYLVCANAALAYHRPLFGTHFFASMYSRMPFSWTMNSLVFGISFALNDSFRELVVNARKDILHDIVFPQRDTTP